jgi:hypothetical protein
MSLRPARPEEPVALTGVSIPSSMSYFSVFHPRVSARQGDADSPLKSEMSDERAVRSS